MNTEQINEQDKSEIIANHLGLLNSRLNNINAAVSNIEYFARKLQSFNELEEHFKAIQEAISKFKEKETIEIHDETLTNIQETLKKDNNELDVQSIKAIMEDITSASNWIVRECDEDLDFRIAQRFMNEFIPPKDVKSFAIELLNNFGGIKKEFKLHYAYGYAHLTLPFGDDDYNLFELNYLHDEIYAVLYRNRG